MPPQVRSEVSAPSLVKSGCRAWQSDLGRGRTAEVECRRMRPVARLAEVDSAAGSRDPNELQLTAGELGIGKPDIRARELGQARDPAHVVPLRAAVVEVTFGVPAVTEADGAARENGAAEVDP